jgi:hypothetical protein
VVDCRWSPIFKSVWNQNPRTTNNMKRSSNLVIVTISTLVAGLAFSGCVTAVGNVKDLPQAHAGFAAKHTYPVPADKAFAAIQTALENNRIGIISADKASGVIRSDTVEGPSFLIAGGLAGGQSTRYSFNVSVRSDGAGVRINVIAKLESSMGNGQGSSQWTDVSGQNPPNIAQLESWLYEQIEAAL